MTNLENIKEFLFEADIETINNFVGNPILIDKHKSYDETSEDVKEFIYRLAKKIRHTTYCSRKCLLRKGK